ncbi:LysR family transcriptional regulator [Amycolatopsis anabasis]|uniref:LysR family transcriptional regulator n=1 Tax=Amycolatopsis anabasis TaxID=1840409 RepID=UPI00131D1F08|nr:LysR family transcriptional regulator [Amycolatopsis anabasis]
MLDVRRLRVLLAVAEHGGIAAAARALSFTPPAVSQQIAALERQLNTVLVDRSRRTARLTAAGGRLAGHAREVLAALEAAEADLAGDDGAVRGVLRIGVLPSLGRALLPDTLARLAVEAPELDLRIEEAEPENGLPALERGELDVVVACEYTLAPRRPVENVERADLFTEPMLVAVPPGHPLPGPRVRLAELRDARWIAPAPGGPCALLFERSCALAGYEPHVVGHCNDFAVAAALVGAGHGFTLIPRIVAPEHGEVRLLTAIDPEIRRTLFAATRPGARRHPAIACLLDALIAGGRRQAID